MRYLISTLALALAASGALAEDFSLDRLVEAARAEPPLSVIDSTGKIVEMADAFAATYGLKATGTKMKVGLQLETVIREVQAGNVQTGVVLIAEVPAALGQLLPTGMAESWLPPDLASDINPIARDPLLVVASPLVFAYNTALHESCPIGNVWELTDPEWKGRTVLQDPLLLATFTDWFSQMEDHADDRLAAAWEAHYGKPFESAFRNATEAFVAGLAGNSPLVTDSDGAASEAAAAPGQDHSLMTLVSVAKFRDNAAKGYTLGLCTGLQPFIGFFTAKVALIPKGAPSPNAAKLFVHYIMTADGIAPQLDDGKISYNHTVPMSPEESSGLAAHLGEMLAYDPSTGIHDWETRQDWQDFWRIHYRR